MTSGRLLAAGALGSVLLALGGTGVGALPPSGWGLLRSATGPALALCVLGGLLLGGAWWASRDRGLAHQRQACALWAAPLLLTPPLFSRDLYAYAGQAALVAAGRDPYADGPGALPGPLSAGVDDVWLDAPAPYGPVWLVLAGAVVRVTGDALVPALVGLRLLAVAGVLLTAWALLRLAPDPARALWLGVANPLVLLHLVAGGHNDALMLGLVAAGLAVAAGTSGRGAPGQERVSRGPAEPQADRRPQPPAAAVRTTPPSGRRPPTASGRRALSLAAALVTCGALVKIPALAGLAFLPLLHTRTVPERVRAAGIVLTASAGTAVVVTVLSGLGWGWLGTLDTGRARLSLFSPLTGLGTAVGALDAVLAAGLVAAVVVGGLLLLRADRLGPLRALGLALLAVAVLLPVVQPWYLLWGTVVLAAAAGPGTTAAGPGTTAAGPGTTAAGPGTTAAGPGTTAGGPGTAAAGPGTTAGVVPPRVVTALGALSLVLCVMIAPSGRNVVRPPLYGLPTVLAASVGLLVLRREVRRDRPEPHLDPVRPHTS